MLTFKFYPKLDKDCTERASIAQKRTFFIKDLFFIRKKLECSNLLKKTLTEKLFFLCSAGFGFHQPQKPCKEPKTALVKHAE